MENASLSCPLEAAVLVMELKLIEDGFVLVISLSSTTAARIHCPPLS